MAALIGNVRTARREGDEARARLWAEAIIIADWCGTCHGHHDPGTRGFQARVERVIAEADAANRECEAASVALELTDHVITQG